MEQPFGRKQLQLRLAEHLREAGFNWHACRGVEPRPTVWERPPLFTELELGGERMQDYLSIRTGFAVDQLLDIYERFISGFLYSKELCEEDSQEWLRRELKLVHYVSRSLFTSAPVVAPKLGHCMNLVQFAALVAYNHRADVGHGPNTFVVTIPRTGYAFGMRDGAPVSNASWKQDVTLKLPRPKTGQLADLARGESERGSGTLLDTMCRWLELNQDKFVDRGAALKLGLQILRWRSAPLYVPADLRELISYDHVTQEKQKGIS